MIHTFDLIGQPPALENAAVQALIAEEFRHRDLLCSPHIVWLQLAGQWWRTFSDGPMLDWQRFGPPPQAWKD